MKQSANAAVYFVDRHIDEGRGDRLAFREASGKGRTLSYGALAEAAARVAGALTRAVIPRESRALMLVLDQIEFPQIFWGCLKAGVIPVPLNTLLATPVYAAILEDSRATLLFVSAELWEVIAPAAKASPWLERIVVIGDAPEGCESFDAFVAGAEPAFPRLRESNVSA